METFEFGQRLIRLEQRLRELETLQHQVHEEALALSQIVIDRDADTGSAGEPRRDSGSRASSVPEAARQLGISVSMVHKLLRERRLGHLKVGARTLITAEHLEQFLATGTSTSWTPCGSTLQRASRLLSGAGRPGGAKRPS